MTKKRIFAVAAGLALLAVLAVGLVQLSSLGSSSVTLSGLSLAKMEVQLQGSPPELASLHVQADQLLGGGKRALEARLGALRGYPVVIEKWASWCESCRAEAGAFQRASVALGRRVAFIGIDSGDHSRSNAEVMLRSVPMSYPSYYDPSGALGEAMTDSSFVPVTVFYDARGERYIRQGAYPSVGKLERDIERYALGA